MARNRSRGVRPYQRHFAMNCPVKVTVSFDRKVNRFVVRECDLDHNHRIGLEIMMHYPTHRKLTNSESKEIEEVLKLGANKKLVKQQIQRKFGKVTTLKDIQNLRDRAKKKEQHGRRDAQIVLDKLSEALSHDPQASGGVVVDDEDNLSILYYRSGLMSELFSKFPEVVLVDGTYNVNKAGMPLYSFMVEDGFGHGRVAFYAAVSEETAEQLETVVKAFKEANPASNQIQVIVIDKDLTEQKVLSEAFPQAKILFCQFHVIKYFHKKVSDCDIPKSDREELRSKLRSLVYAASEAEYNKLKDDIVNLANDDFNEYFESNWQNCKVMWVSYLRDEYLHLANTTNNRLECHHHKLKDLTSRSSTLSEMFDHVLTFSLTHALEYSQRTFVEEFTTCTTAFDHIPHASEIAAICTEHAANLVCEQLELAGKVDYQFKQDLHEENTFEIRYKDHKHFVNIDSNSCTCTFSKTLGLPCRHMFAARRRQELVIFCTSLVRDRWLKSYQIQVPGCEDLMLSAHPDDDMLSVAQSDQFNFTISKLQKKPMKATLSQSPEVQEGTSYWTEDCMCCKPSWYA